jgi:hypothetical protein
VHVTRLPSTLASTGAKFTDCHGEMGQLGGYQILMYTVSVLTGFVMSRAPLTA